MKGLEKVNKTLEEIEDVKIYINQAYMKIDLLEKQIENYKLSENESKENIAKLEEQYIDLCESLDIMNDRESELLEQIENLKVVASSWIMSLMDVRESEVNDRRGEVLREIERRMKELKE